MGKAGVQLSAAGRVRRWTYATAGRGALGYYVLARLALSQFGF